MHRRSLLRLTAAIAALAAPAARAQSDKPALRILVGFPPGGSADVIARLLSERLPSQLGGQAVLVDNKPGAAGRIAIEALKNAPADGNTVIIMPSGPVVLFPHVFKKLGYDPVKDLAPISQLASFQFGIVSGPKSNVKTVAEMLAKAKADPSTATYGSSGNGTVPHFPLADAGRCRRHRLPACALPGRRARDERADGRPHRLQHRRHHRGAGAA